MNAENQESRIKNHGRAAAWLSGLGVLLLASLPPLELLWFRHGPWNDELFSRYMQERESAFVPVENPARVSPTLAAAAFVLPCLLPAALGARRAPGRRGERLTLALFVPLAALAGVFAHGSVSHSARVFEPYVPFGPAWAVVALAVPAALILALRSARAARLFLPLALLWLVLLDWNGWRLPPWHVPGWVAVAGAALILLGDILSRRRVSGTS